MSTMKKNILHTCSSQQKMRATQLQGGQVFRLWVFMLLFMGSISSVSAQLYEDHIGNGNNVGVQVTHSDSVSTEIGEHTLSGKELFPDLAAASRFLGQASLGHSWEDIEYVSEKGVEQWIDEQMNMPIPSTHLERVDSQWVHTFEKLVFPVNPGAENSDGRERDFMYINAFYEKVYTEDDVLRQKVAFSLNQILVIAAEFSKASGWAQYYDNLYINAFGNFRDILYNVSTHYTMGVYLSFRNNKKRDLGLNTFPDENYAREIMQLFSIGLWELNNDGTQKLDENGEPIPTYDIYDIQELSKVFTGFVIAPKEPGFHRRRREWSRDMIFNEYWHDKTAKKMIDGSVLPAGRTTQEDLDDAIDILFNHPNVGPFIGKLMIQHMVKSNPTPAYVNRVATAFNNNGKGVRGDMGAVVKAILMDPEARNCDWISDPTAGKLIQPVERLTKLNKAFKLSTPSGRIWVWGRNRMYDMRSRLGQEFGLSPTVFNFFLPDYAEPDVVAQSGLVSPEFQIMNTNTTINYLNIVENTLKIRPYFNNTVLARQNHVTLSQDVNDEPRLDLSAEIEMYENEGIGALLDRLDILLCGGNLTDRTRNIITNTIFQNIVNVQDYSSESAVKDIIYFIMASDFPVAK